METEAKAAPRAAGKPEKPMNPYGAPVWLEQRVNSMNWELAMLGVFVFYVIIVFVELALDDPKVQRSMMRPEALAVVFFKLSRG